jgi:hypothetical protein
MTNGLDPRLGNIFLDANALDRDGSTRDKLVDRLEELQETEEISISIPGSVRTETNHPHTPASVSGAMSQQISTLPVTRTSGEQTELDQIRLVLRGNALSGKHNADGEHLFEASKYGGRYFITHDRRVLNNRHKLEKLLSPGLAIVTLEEFLAIYDRFANTGSP